MSNLERKKLSESHSGHGCHALRCQDWKKTGGPLSRPESVLEFKVEASLITVGAVFVFAVIC